jgi:hypothetical protein
MAGISWAWEHKLSLGPLTEEQLLHHRFFHKHEGAALYRAVPHCRYLPCYSQMLCASCAACGAQENWILKCSHSRLFSPAVGRKPCNNCDLTLIQKCGVYAEYLAWLWQFWDSRPFCTRYHHVRVMLIIKYWLGNKMKEDKKRLAHGMHIELSWGENLEVETPSKSAKCLIGG